MGWHKQAQTVTECKISLRRRNLFDDLWFLLPLVGDADAPDPPLTQWPALTQGYGSIGGMCVAVVPVSVDLFLFHPAAKWTIAVLPRPTINAAPL